MASDMELAMNFGGEDIHPKSPTYLAKVNKLLRKQGNDSHQLAGVNTLNVIVLDSLHQTDAQVVQDLWESLDMSFVSAMLRTGSVPSRQISDLPSSKSGRLSLVISVLRKFSTLLSDQDLGSDKLTNLIPDLINALPYTSKANDTTETLLQLLATLARTENGARTIFEVDDLTPLTEIASENAKALDVLRTTFLDIIGRSPKDGKEDSRIQGRLDETFRSLAATFKGTDAVTFLNFLGNFLRQADPRVNNYLKKLSYPRMITDFFQSMPKNPSWLQPALKYIQALVVSRPTPEARAAYTVTAASLLQLFPDEACKVLFAADKTSEKPVGFLLVNLTLVDIRVSVPKLLQQLNSPEYESSSIRITSALDIISMFIGFLIRCLEDDTLDAVIMAPDLLLKLRHSVSDTISVVIEFLRDRWDGAVAGAMGLHPEARAGQVETVTGSHRTLTWDSAKNPVDEDPLTLAAIRAMALWVREDENDLLRKEATGMMDHMMDLYKKPAAGGLDFRSAVLVALEGLLKVEGGCEILLENGGWKRLTQDILETLQANGDALLPQDAERGIDVAHMLADIVEQEDQGATDEQMALITATAAWSPPDKGLQADYEEAFVIAVLQLCGALLARAGTGTKSRYRHSISAIAGIAAQLEGREEDAREAVEEIQQTLKSIRI